MSTLFASLAERYVTFVAPLAPEARTVVGAGGAEFGGGASAGPRHVRWAAEKPGLVIAFTSGMGTGREPKAPWGRDEEKRNINSLWIDSPHGTDPAISGGGGNVSSDYR